MRPCSWAIFLTGFITRLVVGAGNTTYTPQNAPYQSQLGQSGYNQCGTGYNQSSECQNAYVNTIEDFCLWAPPHPGSTIGDTEQIQVAWCTKSGYGTRLIPDGTITGAHLVVTPAYIQITGVGNFTNINIPAGDQGGEMDYHGATGAGYPVGGLVFSSAFGQLEQIQEWTSFISYDLFCLRACIPSANESTLCQYDYPIMGCEWNMPGNYSQGVFESCIGDSAEPMGIYGVSTFSQGQSITPPAHPPPPSSSCTFYSTVTNGQSVLPTPTGTVGTAARVSGQLSTNVPVLSGRTTIRPTATSPSQVVSSPPPSQPGSASRSPPLSHSQFGTSSLSSVPQTSRASPSAQLSNSYIPTTSPAPSPAQVSSTSESTSSSQTPSTSPSTSILPDLSTITSTPVSSTSTPFQCPPGYLTRVALVTGGAGLTARRAIWEKLALVGFLAIAGPLIPDLLPL